MFSVLAHKVVYAAHKAGLFRLLENDGPATLDTICERLGTDRYGTRLALETLRGLGYVSVLRGERYRNSRMTAKWMSRNGDAQLDLLLGYFDDAAQRWSSLDQVLLGRKQPSMQAVEAWFREHDGAYRRYHEGLLGIASMLKGAVATGLAVPPDARTIVDIGGSHGLYTIELCRRHPRLTADIFDLDPARSLAERTIAEHGMDTRVRFVVGDVLTDALPGAYDAALMVNTLRVFRHDQIPAVLSKVHDALNPGGAFFVVDQFPTPKGTPFSRLNAGLILLELYNGGSAPLNTHQLQEALNRAGFTRIRFTKLRRTPGIHVVSGMWAD